MITGKRSIISKESARIAQTKTYFDNRKIHSYLPGFSFTSLDEAIKSSCLKYLSHLAGTHS
jgi:hypothetical protein